MHLKWILLLLPLWLCSVKAKAEYFVIKQYHVEVAFTEEGQADFTETIEVEFSEPRHGIFRAIPYRDNITFETGTRRVDRIIKDISVDGFRFSTYKENTNLIVKIGDPDTYVDGRQTYVIHYRVLNPLNFFKDHTEFYWDLLGTSWEVDVEQFTFQVKFPEKVKLTNADVFVNTGYAGEKGKDATWSVSSNELHGATNRVYRPGEALTLAVRIEKNVFKAMSGWKAFIAQHSLLFAVPVFLIGGIFALLYARNRRQTIMTEYFPPEGISPAVAGGFVDHSVDNNDVLSLIPHLANKGYLRLEALEEKGFFQNRTNIIFYKLKDAGHDLTAFEEQFFNALFATGDLVELNDLKDKFYMHMANVKAAVKGWIALQGWYEADQKKLGCLTAVAGLIALAWGAYAIFARQNMDGIALAVTGFILFFFANRFNKRSPAGNKQYQQLEGFRQFVAKAERPVIERLLKDDPLYYDKTMPFALAFGYLKQWNRQFEGLLTQPPSWYSSPLMYGHGGMQSWTTFSENFPSEINSISSVFSSSPSSSSSGGGGGGSSGGGSGGGGGGSW